MTDQTSTWLNKGLLAVMTILLTVSCGVEEEGIPPPLDTLYYPLGLAAHPEGRFLLVSNAVFDRKYNRSYLSVVDTFEGRLIPESSVELDLFAGEVKLSRTCSEQSDAICQPRVIGLVPSRDTNTLTSFEIKVNEEKVEIHCGQTEGTQHCAGAFVQHSGLNERSSDAPYSLSLSQKGAFLSHINTGALSSWYVSDAPPYIKFGCQLQLPGAHYVTVHPTLGSAIVSDRFGLDLHHVSRVPKGGVGCELRLLERLNTRSALNSESRGLAFSASGEQLYVTHSIDGTLKIYASQLSDGGELFSQQLASFPVGDGANLVRVAGRSAADLSESSSNESSIDSLGQGLVYVSSLTDGLITVIDPVHLKVLSRISVGRGAHDISFMLSEEGKLRGYVSLFEEHKLSILDLHPGSETRFKVIGEIK